MREIKFRVWSKWYKKYMTLEQCAKNNMIMPRDNELKSVVNHELIIEQYTGLKDKNGVEIYEGDRVKGESGRTYTIQSGLLGYDGDANGLTGFGFKERKSTVEYEYDNGKEFIDVSIDFMELQYHDSFMELKVIGNIHESISSD